MLPIPVVIPVFNRPEYTQVCLESIYEADLGFSERIKPIVVDNGSRPRTQRLIQAWVDRHGDLANERSKAIMKPTVLRIRRNRGFAAAVNAGFKEIRDGDYAEEAVILHNDTAVFDGWVGEMRECLSEDEEVTVVMPRTNYANEHSPCIRELRNTFESIKPPNKGRIMPDEVRELVRNTFPSDSQSFLERLREAEPRFSYVPEISSFCMLFRTRLLDDYPWFDEDFFLRSHEDKLWFLPMERDGLVCMLANRAYVHHFGNITSDGPGFNFAEGVKVNEGIFREKVLSMNKGGPPDATEDV